MRSFFDSSLFWSVLLGRNKNGINLLCLHHGKARVLPCGVDEIGQNYFEFVEAIGWKGTRLNVEDRSVVIRSIFVIATVAYIRDRRENLVEKSTF